MALTNLDIEKMHAMMEADMYRQFVASDGIKGIADLGGGAVGTDLYSHRHAVIKASDPGHSHGYSAQANAVPNRWSEVNLACMLTSRMAWNVSPCPFKRLLSVRISDDKVATFVVAGGTALIIEDDAHLFPSDAMITQLRLLAETL